MAALLTSERANTDKMVQYIGECREMGIRVLPPDVNESDMFFTVVPGRRSTARNAPAKRSLARRGRGSRSDIRFGLAAIKNVGEGAVEAVLRRARRAAPSARSSTSASGWTCGP